MTMSPEMVAIANRAITSMFELTSIAWRTIPHWETGDPAQTFVGGDCVLPPAALVAGVAPPPGPLGGPPVAVAPIRVPFAISIAQALATSPDAVLSNVIAQAAELARRFDAAVLPTLGQVAAGSPWSQQLPVPSDPAEIIAALIAGRELVEDSGFLAPSALVAGTPHFTDLHQLTNGRSSLTSFLAASNANTLIRASSLNGGANAAPDRMLLIGRRQDIPQGGARDASAGDEPIDLAVAVPPSLEVVGANAAGNIDLAVRIAYAVRIKDARAVVVFHT